MHQKQNDTLFVHHKKAAIVMAGKIRSFVFLLKNLFSTQF